MYPVYSLYMKEGDRFLLAARKRSGQKTSNYIISNDADDLERDSSSFMGKLRSNFIGTEFVVYDNGANPKEMKKSSNKLRLRQEIAIVNYVSDLFWFVTGAAADPTRAGEQHYGLSRAAQDACMCSSRQRSQ